MIHSSASPLTLFLIRMAEYVESKEKSQKTTLESQKAKLAALEKQLGIQSSSSSAAGLGAASSSSATEAGPSQTSIASASTPSASAADVDVSKIAQKRHRFEDNGYFETSREINDGVRSAVTAGMSRLHSCVFKRLTVCFPRFTKETKEGQGRACNQSVGTYHCECRVVHRCSQCMSVYLSCVLLFVSL
jgi:hypothetical protein